MGRRGDERPRRETHQPGSCPGYSGAGPVIEGAALMIGPRPALLTTELTEVPLADVDCTECACAPTSATVVTPTAMLPAITPTAHFLLISDFLE